MPSKWPIDITFKEIVLSVYEKTCKQCGSDLASVGWVELCCTHQNELKEPCF